MQTVIPELIFQGETNECGLACIAMLAETQGRDITLDRLRTLYPASDHGTSLATLCDILADLDIPTYPVSFEHHELSELPLPAILHYGASHYVLLAYRKGNHVCVMNPAIGQQLLPVDALKLEISGYALVIDQEALAQQKQDGPLRHKPARFKALKVMSLKQTSRIPNIYKLMLVTFLVSLSLFIMPAMVSTAINDALASPEDNQFPYLWYLLAFVIATLAALGVRVFTERVVKRFILLNGAAGFSRLLSNSLRFFDKRAPGEVFSRFAAWQMAAARKIELDNGLRTDWIIGTLAFVLMTYISPPLALISAIGVTLMGLISVWAIYRDRYFTQELQARSAEQNDFLLETIQGFSTIKAAALDSQRKNGFAHYARSLFTMVQQQRIYEEIKSSLYQMIGSLEMVFFMLLALPLLASGSISFGEFFAYSFVRQIFTGYITRIFYSIIQKNQIHVIDTRAQDLFPSPGDETFEEIDDEESDGLKPVTFDRQIRYSDIGYGYTPDRNVLQDISLTLARGQHLAIIGESGAGKSTWLRIMAGLVNPRHGSISVDDEAIKSRQLRPLFFLQSQEDILFNASILQNITLFDSQFDETQLPRIEALLRGLNLDSVIDKLPGRLNALIRESHAALSLGQRQRLLLARAMYSRRLVLLLDEPTANLDETTARMVIDTLLEHCRKEGKTLVIVTHSERILSLFDAVWQIRDGHLLPHIRNIEPESDNLQSQDEVIV